MKKQILIATLAISTLAAWAQGEKKDAPVQKVTVFMNGAQVQRSTSMNLTAGEQTITFTGLSPYTDTKSMQVKARGKLTVLGVNYRTTHPDSLKQSRQRDEAKKNVKAIVDKQQELEAQKEVIVAQLEMLKTNSSVAGRTAVTPLAGIKELNNYYSQELLSLKKRMKALDEEIEQLDEVRQQRQKTLDSIAALKLKAAIDVDVKLDMAQAGRAEFDLVYYVKNAGWYPTYDIRSIGITQPLQLSYKANVFQKTEEEWKNIPVTLSSANPSHSNIAPELQTYWIDYGRQAPRYDQESLENGVQGRVTDNDGEPIIGATVTIVGTQIATVTDIDGRYSITLPRDKHRLQFSFIGYASQTRTATGPTLNVTLQEDQAALNEVVVVGYGSSKAKRRGRANDSAAAMEEEELPRLNAAVGARPMVMKQSDLVEVEEQKAQFGYEFEIKKLLTIPANGKTTTTEIGRYELPATYNYHGIPRADKDAFLVADATSWQQLSLLEGEANVYFENSFVGKTIIDPSQPTDTLHFSLGRDNGIRIQRVKVADRSTHKLLASTQEQNMTWRITVKNTRKEAVGLKLQDQIPVSQNSNITVTAEELSGGKLDKERGFVTWELQLQPGEQRELILQYRVKYPKSRRLVVE